ISVTWLLRLRMRCARPCGAAWMRLSIRPLSTLISLTIKPASSRSAPSFFACQFAIALNSNFSKRLDASFGLYFKMANAFSTSTPRIWSATKRILRGDVGQSLSLAIAIAFFAALSASAACLFLAPISIISYSYRDRGSYASVKIHPVYDLPCFQSHILVQMFFHCEHQLSDQRNPEKSLKLVTKF